MQDPIIQVEDLSKVYRLYRKPHYRFLDMFGLLRHNGHAYTEHAALAGVSLAIRRGEKVAVIGRNGAGKSTLLKLITDVIQPTSGNVDVKGKVHALLQIGSGFHPDFSGRDNVLGYLAQFGVVGQKAQGLLAEIVEFSELEEYIDQPVKTYSTGMAARLMFSTSVAIHPDVLVIDEILGVGDAYFARKSFERMKELCDGEGTTLLLVTHDVYAATLVASRIIWIDQGRILMDGDPQTVVKAYEDSIRAQEEHRLRLQKRAQLDAHRKKSTDESQDLLVEVRSRDNRPLPGIVYFSKIALYREGEPVAALPWVNGAFDSEAGSHLQEKGTCWGDSVSWQGRDSRPMLNYGSPFHKVAGVLSVAMVAEEWQRHEWRLVFSFWAEEPCELLVSGFLGEREWVLGALSTNGGEWTSTSLGFDADAADGQPVPRLEVNASGIHGTGTITVDNVRVLDETGRETHTLRHGRPATFVLDYRIVDPTLREKAQVVIALHRSGVETACRFISRDLLFDASTGRNQIRLQVPKLMLGNGVHSLTVLIAKAAYYDTEQTVFFSMNPGVYFCLARFMEIEIVGGGLIADGAGWLAEGEWRLVEQGP